MDVLNIYNRVKEFVVERYGTRNWCYTDFFEDQNGFNYFKEQIEADKELKADWTDEDIVEHICDSLSSNMTMYTFEQSYLKSQIL